MQEIIKIDETTYRIEDNGVRFFLLIGENKALMIDSGMNAKNALDIVRPLTNLSIELLNTHGDPDHISGNDSFSEVYINEKEIDNYRSFNKNDIKFNFVKTGDIIDLGNRPLKVIELAGHTPGSIAILDVNNRVLIGGDSIQDGKIFMFGPARDMNLYNQTLNSLWCNYQNDFDVVYPSHSNFPVNKDIIPQLIDASKQIIESNVSGNEVDFHGNKITLCDFGFAGFLVK